MRRVWPHLGGLLAIAVAVPLLAIAAALVSFNTPQGRLLIMAGTEWLTHGDVRLRGLTGRFPDRLRLSSLSIADPNGPWMLADDLALDWSPMQLLHGRAQVELATARRIQMLRRPQYPPKPPRPHRSPLRLPFTVQLDRLALPDVQLSAALAGNPVAMSIDGQGSFRSLEQAALQLRAQRLDSVPSVYGVLLQSNAAHIQGRLDLQENAGGPLANLLLLPGLGALSVHLDLLGPPDALATTLDARAGVLRAQATGTLDLPALAANLNLQIESGAMTPRPGLTWQHVGLHVQAQGPFVSPSSSAVLTVAGLEVGALQIESGQADLHGEGHGLALEGNVSGLTLPGPFHSMFARSPIHLDGQALLISSGGMDFDLALTHPLLAAQAHYELGPAGSGVEASRPGVPRGRQPTIRAAATERNGGTLTATVPNLAPYAELVHMNLQGGGHLQAELSVLKQVTQLSLSGDVALRDGDQQWVRLLGPHAQFAGEVDFGKDQIALERAQLTSPYLQASARGQKRDQAVDLSWQVALVDLSRLPTAARGRVDVQGRVQGTLQHLNATAAATSDYTRAKSHAVLHATLRAEDLTKHPSARLDVDGTLNDAPLELGANLRSEGSNNLTLALDRVDWRSLHADGTLHVDGDLLAPEGSVSLQLGRLQDLDAFIGMPVQGRAAARIAFDRPARGSRAVVSIDAPQLTWGSVELKALQLQGDVLEPLSQPRFALRLSSDALLHGTDASIVIQADGPLNALALHTRASVTLPAATTSAAPAAVSTAAAKAAAPELSAAAIWNQPTRQLKLTELEASYRDQNARLVAPAVISLADGITIDRLRLQLPPAVIQLSGRVAPTLDVRATVRNLNPSVFGVVLPVAQAQGHTDIDVELHGALQRPSGKLTLTAGGLGATTGATRGLPPAALRVVAQLADGSADVNATLSAGTGNQLRASGRIPLQRSEPMTLALSGGIDLGVVNPVLEASGQRLVGQLNVEAQVSGTLASPQARGSLTISHADVQDYLRGVHLTDLSLALDAEGSQLLLKQFSAHAGSGTLAATGSVDLAGSGMPVQLEFTAQNAEPIKTDLITANLNADLRVTGAVLHRELAASGTVKINRATVNIPNALPPDIPTLQVVRPGQTATPAQPRPLIARLDLTLNAPRGIFVRGRGLNAEVGGTVHIGGTGETPAVSGSFDLINGIMDLSGATLTFNSGRVSFNGTGLHQRIDPTLDFVAASAIGGVQANLEVTGYATAPVITLTSTPPEPQDQILAQLLFGQNVSQLSALQAAGIASALVTLTGAGGGGGLNPLNTVQQALGLNRLVISSTAPSGAATPNQTSSGVTIQAGRYVSNRIYVGAKESTNGLTQAQVQVDLTRQLKVQTTLSSGGGTVQGATPENDPGSNVGLSYQFQY